MGKPVIKFKTYRQAAAVGGKIYGVPNLGDPVVAEVTMQEVIDYAKLHNYSADTLSALLSQVIAGVGDLVARDGRPRMLSDLLKFEPVIKGTFDNMEQTVTSQKVLVRPRMLKEIKVALDARDYAWQNVNDKDSPRLISFAAVSDLYSEPTAAAFNAAIKSDSPADISAAFGWTVAGQRLCPNGWDPSCSFKLVLRHGGVDYHFEKNMTVTAGVFEHNPETEASDNVFLIDPTAGRMNAKAWYMVGQTPAAAPADLAAVAGDLLTLFFTRTTGSGDTFTVQKAYLL